MKRIVIYNKDVQRITGRSKTYATRLLTKIRKQLNKPARSLITIDEFCQATGYKEQYIEKFLD
jgi:hypothetical protein